MTSTKFNNTTIYFWAKVYVGTSRKSNKRIHGNSTAKAFPRPGIAQTFLISSQHPSSWLKTIIDGQLLNRRGCFAYWPWEMRGIFQIQATNEIVVWTNVKIAMSSLVHAKLSSTRQLNRPATGPQPFVSRINKFSYEERTKKKLSRREQSTT